jgi:hypothetical protein
MEYRLSNFSVRIGWGIPPVPFEYLTIWIAKRKGGVVVVLLYKPKLPD